jgi:hypothetical protein
MLLSLPSLLCNLLHHLMCPLLPPPAAPPDVPLAAPPCFTGQMGFENAPAADRAGIRGAVCRRG